MINGVDHHAEGVDAAKKGQTTKAQQKPAMPSKPNQGEKKPANPK